jgi:CheY-like chemotaxis protein
VLNLCANARDAVGPTGSISVSLTRVTSAEGAPRARLTVLDDGVGMDEAMRARVFEPYLTTKTLGHGLGLAVVHGIVTGAGGTIEVESEKGKGTRFDLHFPLLETPAEAKPAPLESVGGHERVLLVEDQPMVRSALRRLLASLGYVVTEASDGQEALDRVRATPTAFDLVLSDQTMPRLSGLELAKALLAELPNVRVLLCTGFSEHLDEASALKLGVRGVLAKPVDRATMASAVRAALR